ncbi:MAG: hypothetical protein AAF386_10555 [Pseudomonadota bacterium]
MTQQMIKAAAWAVCAMCPALVAAPARAAQVALPAGCEAFVTVQQRQCLVTHHYTCQGDPEGHQWRVDLTDEGMVYVAQIDNQAQWIYSLDLFSGREERLVTPAADPASMDDLLAGEIDTWDFQTASADGESTRFFGYDLTSGTTQIDGVDLLITEAEITAESASGETLWSAKGSQYVSTDWRMFLFGVDTYTNADGESWAIDHTPVDFIFPGEPGFLTDDPSYDCDVVMSSFDGGSQ